MVPKTDPHLIAKYKLLPYWANPYDYLPQGSYAVMTLRQVKSKRLYLNIFLSIKGIGQITIPLSKYVIMHWLKKAKVPDNGMSNKERERLISENWNNYQNVYISSKKSLNTPNPELNKSNAQLIHETAENAKVTDKTIDAKEIILPTNTGGE